MVLQLIVLNFFTSVVFGDNGNGYHSSIGIPAAKYRLKMENKALKGLDSRVAGGGPVPHNSILYPWLAGIIASLPNDTYSMCGATLLTGDRLITAGHCWEDTDQKASHFEIVLGTTYLFCTNLYCSGIRINSSHVVTHPGWDPNIITSVDAAVIYLPHRIYFTPAIYPIALPLNNLMDSFEGCPAIVAGYGRIDGKRYRSYENPLVNHVAVKVISNKECIQRFHNKAIQLIHMCTSGEGAVGICQGDSGGPLISMIDEQYTLIGIDVLGYYKGCNQSYPSVYIRITSIIDFIIENLNIENSI